MFDRCILHIGTEKTGTTSVQAFLSQNRAALARAGVFVPRKMGQAEHFDLVRAVVAPHKRFGRLRLLGDRSDKKVIASQLRLRREIAAELATAKGYHTVIISSERLGARVNSPQEAAVLRDLLAPFVKRLEIWVYLRPQVAFATSFYSTELRSGARRRMILPNIKENQTARQRFDYDGLLRFWQTTFPDAILQPQIFAREDLTNGDVVIDFLGRIGVDPTGMKMPTAENPSLNRAAQLYLRALNAAIHAQPQLAQTIDRERIVRRLNRDFAGKGRQPGRAAAKAFAAEFAVGNEAVRATYFPERTALFQEDLTALPEIPESADLSDADYRAIAKAVSGQSDGLAGRTPEQAIAADIGLRRRPWAHIRQRLKMMWA